MRALIVESSPAALPVVSSGSTIPAPSLVVLNDLTHLQTLLLSLPEGDFQQIPIHTEHLLWGGMYARTTRREFDSVTIGSLINKATILIVNGSCSMLIGDRRMDLEGYNVLAGMPGRKSMSVARGPVEMTMIFPTSAKTVEEAENEIFAEAGLLASRRQEKESV